MPERLGEPHVPDPGDDPLIDEGIADEPHLVDPPQALDERTGIGCVREQIGPECADSAAAEAENGSVPVRRLPLGDAQDQPRRSAPGRAPTAANAPPAVHPEVTAYDDIAVEVQEHVLADRLDVLEYTPVDRSRDTRLETARIRALRLDALTDENLQAPCDAMERITLGHATERARGAVLSRLGGAARRRRSRRAPMHP